jgi:hypothetical protein
LSSQKPQEQLISVNGISNPVSDLTSLPETIVRLEDALRQSNLNSVMLKENLEHVLKREQDLKANYDTIKKQYEDREVIR